MEWASVAPVPKKTNAAQIATGAVVTPAASSASIAAEAPTPAAKSGSCERPLRARASASRPKKKYPAISATATQARPRRRGAVVARDIAQPGRDPEGEKRDHRALVGTNGDGDAPESGIAGDVRKAAKLRPQRRRRALPRMLRHPEREQRADHERRAGEAEEDLPP